jgi:hypothetical protein
VVCLRRVFSLQHMAVVVKMRLDLGSDAAPVDAKPFGEVADYLSILPLATAEPLQK